MNPTRRALVTGAGGFVCGQVIQAMLESGWSVAAVDRAFDAARTQEWQAEWGAQITILETDLAGLPPLEVDALVHGAAVTATPEEAGQTPEANFRANVEPALTMLEWAERQRVRRSIFLSSSAVYRETQPGPVSETMPPSPLGLYAVAKRTMESLIETVHKVYGRDVIAVRLSSIYGLGEHSRPTRPRISLVGKMVQTALETGTLVVYTGDRARDWTLGADVGRALVALLDAPALRHSLYHVASEQVLTSLQIANAIRAALPEVHIEVRDGVDPASTPLTRLGYLSSERLRQETGFDHWTPFADGIRQVLERQPRKEMAR